MILCPTWMSHPKSVCQHHSGSSIVIEETPCWLVAVSHLPGQPPRQGSVTDPRQPWGMRSGVSWASGQPTLRQRVVKFPEKDKWGQGPCKSWAGMEVPDLDDTVNPGWSQVPEEGLEQFVQDFRSAGTLSCGWGWTACMDLSVVLYGVLYYRFGSIGGFICRSSYCWFRDEDTLALHFAMICQWSISLMHTHEHIHIFIYECI